MPLELDHVYICCAEGAPEADVLLQSGFIEGSGNVHPGQGTSNRRFFFGNAYLELLWVHDVAEARSPQTERTRIWQRWWLREGVVCPFGILFRATDNREPLPFSTWSYAPAYLPAGLTLEFAEGTRLNEPELVHLPFRKRTGPPATESWQHGVPIREILSVTVFVPDVSELSPAAAALHALGVVRFERGPSYLLELVFSAEEPRLLDLRPALPLVFRGVSRPMPSD